MSGPRHRDGRGPAVLPWLVLCQLACGAAPPPPPAVLSPPPAPPGPWASASTHPLMPQTQQRVEAVLVAHHLVDIGFVRGLAVERPGQPETYLVFYTFSSYAEWEARLRRSGTLEQALAASRQALAGCAGPTSESQPAQREQCELAAWPSESIARTGDRSGCLAFHVAWLREAEGGELTLAQGRELEPAVCGADPRGALDVDEMFLRDLDVDGAVELLVRYRALGPSGRVRGGTDFERLQVLGLPELEVCVTTELASRPPGEERSWVARYQLLDRNGDGHDDLAVAGAEFTAFCELDDAGWPVPRQGEAGTRPPPARPGDEGEYECVLWESDRLWLYDPVQDLWQLQPETSSRPSWGVER